MKIENNKVKLSFFDWLKIRVFGKRIITTDIYDGHKTTVECYFLNGIYYVYRWFDYEIDNGPVGLTGETKRMVFLTMLFGLFGFLVSFYKNII